MSILERAAAEGKSIRQVIDEDPAYAKLSEEERVTLAKATVADMLVELTRAGATREQLADLLRPAGSRG